MLNATFSRLRSALATLDLDVRKVLQSSGGVVGFLPPVGTRIDVAVATRSIDAAEGALRRNDLDAAWSSATVAHSIARRPLLPGVDLVWLDTERDRLHHVLERSLTVLSDVWLERGDAQQSATMAKELIRCAPYSESAYRRLVTALVALGDRPQAAHAVKRWNTVLTEELGLPADDRLRTLVD
jgi:DNA-binding SARP family transcriptional activator